MSVILSFLVVAMSSAAMAAGVAPSHLTAEYRTDPVGLDAARPRLSWRLGTKDGCANVRQGAAQVLVASSRELLADDRGDLWDSGKMDGGRSLNVEYGGRPLPSSRRVFWKVRTWDREGAASDWSPAASWVVGKTSPWTAQWIGDSRTSQPAFEKSFSVRSGLVAATLHVSGLGYYVASLNGMRVGDKVLDPSPTSYDRRVLYSTYDVTSQLREGANAIKVLLGRGWYDVPVDRTWNFDEAPWRDRPRLLAELELFYADGSQETVSTDKSWRTCANPVAYDSLREGEVIDARADSAPFESRPAQVVAAPRGKLVAAAHPGSNVVRTLKPVRVARVADGWMVSFDENFAGWIRLRMRGQSPGSVIAVRYDERIGEDGCPASERRIDMFNTTRGKDNPRPGPVFQTDRYVCSGAAEETYEPFFNYNGFQYVYVTGLQGDLSSADILGCVVRTAFEKTGSFESSDPLLNRLMAAAERSYEANFVQGFPTDCPHREKNGWTGDAAIASEFAQYVCENTAAYEKWLRDVCDAMTPEGKLPGIVPAGVWGGVRDATAYGPVWDAALPAVAWNLWIYRGDRRILDEVWPQLEKMLAFTASRADAEGLVDYGLGDWLPVDDLHKPSVCYTSSAYYCQAQLIAAKIAAVKGLSEASARYAAGAAKTRRALRRKFASSDGARFENGRQTAMALALSMRLMESDEVEEAADCFVQSIRDSGVFMDFGLVGSKHLFRALSSVGETELALDILLRKTDRSFAKWMESGSTTLWEDFGDGASRNHVMYGDFSAWAYQHLAGIRVGEGGTPALPETDAPGFGRFLLAPQPVRRLSFVRASTVTPYGRVASAWERQDGKIRYSFEIPPNASARVVLPKGLSKDLGSGVWTFEEDDAPCVVSVDFTRETGRAIRPLAGTHSAVAELPKEWRASELGPRARRTAAGAAELAGELVRLQKETDLPEAAAIVDDPRSPDCILYSFPDGDTLPPYHARAAFLELYERGREGKGTEAWSSAGGPLKVLAAQAKDGERRQAFMVVNPSRHGSQPLRLEVKGGPRFYKYCTIDRDSRGWRHEGRIKSGDRIVLAPSSIVIGIAE